MIRAIAIDDEPLALDLLKEFCAHSGFIELLGSFTRSSDALSFMQEHAIDLLFLDIRMPDISGIELYKTLKDKAMVIFTTAYPEYAVEGFNLNAVDYLLKPYDEERFLKAAQKAREFYEYTLRDKNESNYIFVRSAYSLVRIDCSDILYIESLEDYVRIHLLNKKPIMTLGTLKGLEEKLPGTNFIRVHRSYLVALDKIERVRGKHILIAGTEIPVSSKYEADFFRSYNGNP